MSARYRVAVYVGPAHVAQHAAHARGAGFAEVLEGTETVYAVVASPVLVSLSDRDAFRRRVATAVYGRRVSSGGHDVAILGAL